MGTTNHAIDIVHSPIPVVQEASDPPSGIDKSSKFAEFCNRYANIQKRFLEREEFLKSFVGKQVIWEGFISDISSMARDNIIVSIRPNLNSQCGAIASFDSEWKTKLFSLQPGDRVSITANYEESYEVMTFLDGRAITVLDTHMQSERSD